MTVRISDAYRLVRHLAAASPGCPLDLRDLDREVAGAEGVLVSDEKMFDESVADVVAALSGGNVPVDYEISTLCGFAMNLATVFNNLANDLETLVVYRRESGQAAPGAYEEGG